MKFRIIGSAALLLTSFSAYSLEISPGDEIESGDQNGTKHILEYLEGQGYDLGTWIYGNDVGGSESGPAAGMCSTTFDNTPSDPSEATISCTGDVIVEYLLVKDGDGPPVWYLFDLDGHNMSDMDLELTGFWPDQGAISFVRLYGTYVVPEPATLSLLGASLLAFGVMGRRRRRNG